MIASIIVSHQYTSGYQIVTNLAKGQLSSTSWSPSACTALPIYLSLCIARVTQCRKLQMVGAHRVRYRRRTHFVAFRFTCGYLQNQYKYRTKERKKPPRCPTLAKLPVFHVLCEAAATCHIIKRRITVFYP